MAQDSFRDYLIRGGALDLVKAWENFRTMCAQAEEKKQGHVEFSLEDV